MRTFLRTYRWPIFAITAGTTYVFLSLIPWLELSWTLLACAITLLVLAGLAIGITHWINRTPTQPLAAPSSTATLGSDPLDPHGDGTLRPGDHLYDLLMAGHTIMASHRDNDNWDINVSSEPPESEEPPQPKC